MTGEESVIVPSQIIRDDLLEKVNELRDMMGRLPREKVISGMKNHLAKGHINLEDSCSPLPGQFCMKI